MLQACCDDKGLVAIAAWGLGTSVWEDSAERAVRAAQAITDDLPVVAAAANAPPAIASTPRLTARIGDPYLYPVVASDPNGDPLAYSLDAPPAGMSVSAAGLVSWVPAAAQAGATN